MSPQALQQRSRIFSWATFLALFALLGLVGLLGALGYRKLDAIIQTATSASTPAKDRLAVVQSVVASIATAENKSIVYGLGVNERAQAEFEEAKTQVHRQLALLQQLPKPDLDMLARDQRFSQLIEEKIALLEAQMALQDSLRADHVLENLAGQMHETLRLSMATPAPKPVTRPATVQPETKDRPASTGKKVKEEDVHHFLHDFFGLTPRKKASSSPAPPLPDTVAASAAPALTANPPSSARQALPAAVERSLNALTQAEAEAYRQNLHRDLALTERSQAITVEIGQVVAEMEREVERINEAKSAAVTASANQANNLIIAFCIAFPLFLLGITFGAVRYFRSLQRHEAAAAAAQAQAEQLADSRARFLATMSHEIRTPMNAIIGFSTLLLRTRLDEVQREQLTLVQNGANHLLGLVNTVLDHSRLEAGQMPFAKVDFDLYAETKLVLDLLRSKFLTKGLHLEAELPPEGTFVVGDPLRLRQILLNLLYNSYKFTNDGGVMLKVSLSPMADGMLRASFIVRDTGMGIPAERLAAVFNAYEQSDSSINYRFGGSGLGLAITKQLVTQQGGQIEIASQVGSGTTLSFSLPYAPGTTPQPDIAVSMPPQRGMLEGKHALIADDEPFNLRLLESLLTGWGMQVTQAIDGPNAFALAKGSRYDVVLLDYRMPGASGVEVLQGIRKKGLNTKTPALILTASQPEEIMEECLRAGANQVLMKPLDENFLRQHLEALIGVDQPPPLAPLETPAPPAAASYSLGNLARMAGKNQAFLQEMVASFVDSAAKFKLELYASFADQSTLKMREGAHKLAPPTKHLEANRLYELLKEFEKACDREEPFATLEPIGMEIYQELRALLPALREELAQLAAPSAH